MYPIQNLHNYPVPQVNAVKIDINEPKAYGGVNSQGQQNPIEQNINNPYAYPYNPIYNMPTVGQYVTPNAYQKPPLMANIPTPQYPINNTNIPTQQSPINNANNKTSVDNATCPCIKQIADLKKQLQEIQMQQKTETKAIAVPLPPKVPEPQTAKKNTNTIPQPVSTQPVINAPVTQQVTVTPQPVPPAIVETKQIQQPQVAKQVQPVAPVPPVNKEIVPGIDVNGLLTALSSANQDDQTAAIQRIAELAQTNPTAAKALLNDRVFNGLVKVINADTSKLTGPNGKSDPKNLSPLEKAEINKQFAVYTLAILQKNFREEINKLMKTNKLPDVAINDIPFIKEGIVNNLKDNPNPTIREACLSALNYIGRPEDKEVLRTLYSISAKHDTNSDVKKTANEYLAKLPA